MTLHTPDLSDAGLDAEVPFDVELIFSAMDAAAAPNCYATDRRARDRRAHRSAARLHLHARASDDDAPLTLWVRDADARGLGFLVAEALPLGYGGTVELLGPDGEIVTASGVVKRCRACAPGWWEGALTFARPRAELA